MSMRFLPPGMGCARPVEKEKMRKRKEIRKKYFNMVVVVG
jgi:hypothetical protein